MYLLNLHIHFKKCFPLLALALIISRFTFKNKFLDISSICIKEGKNAISPEMLISVISQTSGNQSKDLVLYMLFV